MAKIIIDTHNCSREELEELKEYLRDQCWDFKTDETVEKEETVDVWVDHGHKMGVRRYEREEALQVIKETLKEDKDLRNGRKMKTFSDDELFEIASNHFSIILED